MCAKLAYITDLELKPSGGGAYAVNWHAYQQLNAHFEAVEPVVVTPRVSVAEQRWSQLKRKILRQPGHFAYFSASTLKRNADQVRQLLPKEADGFFFRAATRWCHCQPDRPYFVYLDAVFHTFFYNTFAPEDFSKADLERIWAEEARFLEGASAVFFESQWGLESAIEAYSLSGGHYEALGRGGVLNPPVGDCWDGESLNLVTIAMNFEQKGGDILLEAFPQLLKRYPQLRWHIIGGGPSGEGWRAFPEITYEGKLRPDDPAELARFEAILANAFLTIHATREDTNPLVLTEAAYFGCPAISVRKFGIPELISDGETGLLLDPPIRPEALIEAISGLINKPESYRLMRQKAREVALAKFTWEAIGGRMVERVKECLGGYL